MRFLGARRKPGVFAYLGIAFFGAALCAMVTTRLQTEHQLRTQGVRLFGVVTGFEALAGGNDVLRYTYDFAERRYEVRDLVSDRLRARVAAGDPLPIWVLPQQPDMPMIEDRGIAPTWVGLLIGLGFLVGGLFGLLRLGRRSRR
nr:DUF3592 domain-containing protein [Thiocystis violacea]